MRKVNRNWNDKPTILKNSLKEIEKMANGKVIKKNNKGKYKKNFKPHIYNNNGTVLKKLNQYYYSKCAYCENDGISADIEHYRPKGAVKEDATHEGYYWLCYEWSNLIPVCTGCNSRKGKRTQFPIMGTRVSSPTFLANKDLNKKDCLANSSILLAEQPYLLHPEIDEPKEHLGFELRYGGVSIIPIQGDAPKTRGSETIRICNLNREHLTNVRFRVVIEDLKKEIKFIFSLTEYNKIKSFKDLVWVLAKRLSLKTTEDDKRSNTLLWWYIFDDFGKFKKLIFPLFEDKEQFILEAAFKTYKAGLV